MMNTDRAVFFQQLEQQLSHSEQQQQWLGLLLIDIRDFRAINRCYGFDCGDQLLAHCSEQLSSICTGPSQLFRIGNDEFALLMPALVSVAQLAEFASDASRAINTAFPWQGENFQINSNIGASAARREKDSYTLTLSAEHALSEAKLKQQRYHYRKLGELLPSGIDAQLYIDFIKAMDTEALILYYQPKRPLQGETGVHVEALLRWRRDDGQLVSPDKFLPVCERLGFNMRLNYWVIHSALKDQNSWPGVNKPHIAVNLSADTLESEKLVRLVEQALKRWGNDPTTITIEVTESAFIGDKDAAFASLKQMREMGLRVSIDDFGTGYSSLEYFKDLPADELKIDRSFIRHIHEDSGDRKIVKLIADLAHAFDRKVVAEGIENSAMLAEVDAIGCDFVQGMYIAKPMSMLDLIEWSEVNLSLKQ